MESTPILISRLTSSTTTMSQSRFAGVQLSEGDRFEITYDSGETEEWVFVEQRKGTVRYCEPEVWDNYDLEKVGATLESVTEFNKRLDEAQEVTVVDSAE